MEEPDTSSRFAPETRLKRDVLVSLVAPLPSPAALMDQGSLEARLQASLNVIPAHTWYAAPSGALTFVNRRAADYIGLPSEDPLRFGIETAASWDSHIALIHPDDHEETRATWSACLKAKVPGEAIFRVRNSRGDYRWFISRAEPLRTEDGKLRYWIGINVDIEERKHAELYLAEAQRLAHAGSWAFNSAGFEAWSPELFEIHGLPPGSEAPDIPTYMALVHPEDREFVSREIQGILAEHRPFDFTKRIVRPDGTTRYVRCVGIPSPTGNRLVGTGVDVTDHEELTLALRRSEEKYRLLVDGIDAQVSVVTPSGALEFVNQQVVDYFGKSASAFEGCTPIDGVHPDDLARVIQVRTECLRTGKPYDVEKRLRRHDGQYRWFRASGRPAHDAEGNITRWYVVLTDIEERKTAEEKLEERQRELQQVLDLAPQMVGVFGPNQERLFTNRVALDYLGATLDEWLKQGVGSHVHPDDVEPIKAAAAHGLATRSAYEVEVRIRKHDGSYRWFLVRYNPLCVDQGIPSRWFLACADIEDRKRAEEQLVQENVALREEIDKTSMFEEIVGVSPALTTMLQRLTKVARSDSTVLISGETGTGKELVARAIHKRSARSSRAFVAVNCAAIPRELMASELFGHERGAFTGAVQRRIGRFELASGGTIFLDEVGELLPDTQAALLRVLQERELERIGGSETIQVNVRVITATNRDLMESVVNGSFRQDLFYRLNVFPLEMPSLRERKQDIPLLVEYFIHRYARKAGKAFKKVSASTIARLQSYPWPGNVRELQNVIERSVVVSDNDECTVDESWLSRRDAVKSSRAFPRSLAVHAKVLIEQALRASAGRVSGPRGAAARLGIARSTLETRIRSLKINKKRFRARPIK
jgi:PAS domain S-box-containing protein